MRPFRRRQGAVCDSVMPYGCRTRAHPQQSLCRLQLHCNPASQRREWCNYLTDTRLQGARDRHPGPGMLSAFVWCRRRIVENRCARAHQPRSLRHRRPRGRFLTYKMKRGDGRQQQVQQSGWPEPAGMFYIECHTCSRKLASWQNHACLPKASLAPVCTLYINMNQVLLACTRRYTRECACMLVRVQCHSHKCYPHSKCIENGHPDPPAASSQTILALLSHEAMPSLGKAP